MGWEPRHMVETKNIYIILTYIDNWSLLTPTLQTPPIPPGAPSSPALPWRLRTKTALACAARFFFRFWSQWYLIMIMWIISGTVGFRRSPVLPFFDNFVSVSSPTRCAPSLFSSSMILKGQINFHFHFHCHWHWVMTSSYLTGLQEAARKGRHQSRRCCQLFF